MDNQQPPQQPTPTQVTPQLPQKKKLSLKWIIISTLFVLAVLGITIPHLLGISLFYPTPTKQATKKPLPTVTIAPTVNPTSNWKTYIDSKFYFSFSYPPDLNLNEFSYDTARPNNKSILKNISLSTPKDGSILGFSVTTESVDNVIKRTEQESLSGQRYIEIKEKTTEKIGDILWSKIVWSFGSGEPNGFDYIINNKNNTIIFNCGPAAQKNNGKNTCQTILSTFKFTNENSSLTTYTNPIFSLGYPKNWTPTTQNDTVTFSSPPVKICPACDLHSESTITVSVLDNSTALTLNKFISNYETSNQLTDPTEMDKTYLKVLTDKGIAANSVGSLHMPGECGAEFIFVTINNRIVLLEFNCTSEQLTKQILQTFQLTSQPSKNK